MDIGTKRKAEAAPDPAGAGGGSKSGSRAGEYCQCRRLVFASAHALFLFSCCAGRPPLLVTVCAGTPFKRVDESEWIGSKFHITKDNSYFALGLDESE